jgi:isoquinoline 1-oxidoreductase subunit beta
MSRWSLTSPSAMTAKSRIPRLDMGIDCGTVVNPDRVRAQLEGAAIMSIGNALYGNITVKDGRV